MFSNRVCHGLTHRMQLNFLIAMDQAALQKVNLLEEALLVEQLLH